MSSYWQAGEALTINLLPGLELVAYLKEMQQQQPHKQLKTVLAELFPKKLLDIFLEDTVAVKTMAALSHREFAEIAANFHSWSMKPNGTEGYRTAEVTLGGVDCDALSSKTMEVIQNKGLYFIGEVLDVSGWLGGYNFQWAWSSGWAAGQVV